MEKDSIYKLGEKVKAGDDIALIKIIDKKRGLIQKMSYGSEDAYQYILERLIKGIKNYKF